MIVQANYLHSKPLSAIYLVTGDELLLLNECRAAIKEHAASSGFTESCLFRLENSEQIAALQYELNSFSLFNAQKIIEIRCDKAKLAAEVKQIILNYCANPGSDYLLLLTTPKLATAETKQSWYKAIDNLGIIIPIREVSHLELPEWIKKRMQALSITCDAAGYQLIAECVQGNLLAAFQEIQKLALLHPAGFITTAAIQQALANNTRYDVFELADAALAQQTKPCLKILSSLKTTAAEPAIILWALCQDLRKLALLQQASPRNIQQFNALCQQHAIWNNRQKLFKQAASQLSLNNIYELIKYAKTVDALIKGIESGNVWNALQRLCAAYTSPSLIQDLLACTP